MTMAIGIDPRIRARRIAVRRAEGRRRLRVLTAVGAVLMSLIAGWAVTQTALLDLDHVQIAGTNASNASAIQEVVGVAHGAALVNLDLGGIESRIEALAWVETVNVRRQWPGTLRIDVVERVAVASVPTTDGTAVLIDQSGIVIGAATGDALSLVPRIEVLSTVALGETLAAALPGLLVADQMPADLLLWIEAITVEPVVGADGRAVIGLDLLGSAVVDMGQAELIADKLAALRSVLNGADLSCVRLIDVRVADLTTLTRDPVCDGRDAQTNPSDSNG